MRAERETKVDDDNDNDNGPYKYMRKCVRSSKKCTHIRTKRTYEGVSHLSFEWYAKEFRTYIERERNRLIENVTLQTINKMIETVEYTTGYSIVCIQYIYWTIFE